LKILFYNDSADFGGHEVMTLAAVHHLLAQPNVEVGFMFFGGNTRLATQINELATQHPRFRPLPQVYASRRFQVFRTLVSGRAIRLVASAMQDFGADVVVVAQGAISVCGVGLMAGKRLGVPTLSYIPMTHPASLFAAFWLIGAVQEAVNRIHYRLPDEYITICQRMKDYLLRRGLRQPICIVQNGIDLTALHESDRNEARARFGFTANDRVIALIGRVQFWQKRHDLAIRGLALARRQNAHLKLMVVGEGPDLSALKDLVRGEGVEDAVVFAAWTDDLSAIFSAIDALMIPSRYEGVPLVMLEAMYFRRPVVAAAVDGMADTLPSHWLFPAGDTEALAARLLQVLGADEAELLNAHRALVLKDHSRPAFQSAFMAAIVSAANRQSGASPALASRGTVNGRDQA